MIDADNGTSLHVKVGRKRFTAILEHPRRQQIDAMLFEQHTTVRAVANWLQAEAPETPISYAMLARYKNAQIALTRPLDSNVRRTKARNDLEVLDLIIERGRCAFAAGYLPTATQTMRAIELRSQMLAMFPDASGQLEAEFRGTLTRLLEAINELLTEQQRRELVRILETVVWSDD